MFTHPSGWKSRVEIDQSAREGRLRQEWREAPHENDRVSILVIFWSVLGLVLKVYRAFWKLQACKMQGDRGQVIQLPRRSEDRPDRFRSREGISS